jgi:hypothetical protein
MSDPAKAIDSVHSLLACSVSILKRCAPDHVLLPACAHPSKIRSIEDMATAIISTCHRLAAVDQATTAAHTPRTSFAGVHVPFDVSASNATFADPDQEVRAQKTILAVLQWGKIHKHYVLTTDVLLSMLPWYASVQHAVQVAQETVRDEAADLPLRTTAKRLLLDVAALIVHRIGKHDPCAVRVVAHTLNVVRQSLQYRVFKVPPKFAETTFSVIPLPPSPCVPINHKRMKIQ